MLSMKVNTQTPLGRWGIVLSLTALYLLAIVLFKEKFGEYIGLMSVLPVVAVGWLFGLRWGLVAGIVTAFLNIILLGTINEIPWAATIANGGFIASFFLILAGVTAGSLKSATRQTQTEHTLRSRERFLSLLNDITHTIITSEDFDSLMRELVRELANLLEADDCYITRWDGEKEQAFPVATTAELTDSFRTVEFPRDKKNLTTAALESGNLIVAEDLEAMPFTSPGLARLAPAKSAMSIPLIVGKAKIGAVIVVYRQKHVFTEEEKQNADQAGDQIALALWNAQQDFELQKRLRESDAMTRIARALSETERIGLTKVLELIVNSAKELIPGAEQAVIHSLDVENELLVPEAVVGFQDVWAGKAKMRLGKGIASQAIASGETINVTDVQTDSRFVNLGDPVQFRSLMVTPIISGNKILGTISVQSKKPNAFTSDETDLLRTLGTNAAIAIENAHLLEDTQQTLRETNALYHISQGLLALNADELLNDAVELLEKNLGYHLVQVYLIESETGDFILKASSGETGKLLLARNHRLKAGSGIIGHVAETREPFFTNNVDQVIFYIKNPLRPDIRSEMAVPIKAGNQLLGILDIQQSETKNFTRRDLQLVGIVADQLAASLQKAELYENLQQSLEQEKTVRNQLVQNERLAIMGRLLASVSHELNNPLQAIQNALFLLREEQGISDMGRNDLEIVLSESERMAGLIERLRSTYRPFQAEDFQPLQLNGIIEDVYALIATHLRKNQITFQFHPDPQLPIISALPDQIRQVALNLLLNAVEAMTNGGSLIVRTQFLPEMNEVLLIVTDSGDGIAPTILPMIFDPFVTNKQKGTGIGLTISHDIILKHNGRITAENNPERGATFKVWLPVNPMKEE